MSRRLRSATVLAITLAWAACTDSPVDPGVDAVELTAAASKKAKPGVATDAASLQAALDDAAVGGGTVRISGTITLDAPLTYRSDHPLNLRGTNKARIVGPMVSIAAPSNSGRRVGEETAGDGLQILGEPDLSIRNLTFESQSGHGIYFEVTDDASGTIRIGMNNTHFTGQGLSGMWVEEQAGGSEGNPDPIESAASIELRMRNVSVSGTGFAEDDAQSCRTLAEGLGCSFADFDGIRINEGGSGDIILDFRNVSVTGNAGDGVEFDEIGPGEVRGTVNRSDFSNNGEQPQFPADLEDGFDIDEAGAGGIHLVMRNTTVNNNIDEGVDLDESDVDENLQDILVGAGDVYFEARGVRATGNADENIKISDFLEISEFDDNGEEIDSEVYGGPGDIVLAISNVIADGSAAGRGARFEELGDGNVLGFIRNSSFSDNTADDGLRIDEEDAGFIDIELIRVRASGNDGQGLQMTESGDGDIIAQITRSAFEGNDNTQVELEEADDGAHDVEITRSILIGGSEESLDVIEEDSGDSVVTIKGGAVDPAPIASADPVTFIITP